MSESEEEVADDFSWSDLSGCSLLGQCGCPTGGRFTAKRFFGQGLKVLLLCTRG